MKDCFLEKGVQVVNHQVVKLGYLVLFGHGSQSNELGEASAAVGLLRGIQTVMP